MNKKTCCNCRNYKPFYRKGFCNFWRERLGLYVKSGKTAEEKENCEFWKRRTADNNVTIKMLDKGIKDVQTLEEYL